MPEIVGVRSFLPLENLLTGMALETDRNLLLLENDGGRVSRLTFNPVFQTIRVEPLHEGLIDPVGLVLMEDGSLLVVERAPGRVVRIHNGQRDVLLEDLDDPSSARIGDDGSIIVAETGRGRILSYDLQTRATTVMKEDRRFPSDAFLMDQTLIIAELFERQGVFGQVVRLPIALSILDTVISWINDSFIIDPTRLALDPVHPNSVLVSVRQLKSELLDDTRYGAVLRLDLTTGIRTEVVINELISPTEVIVVRDGFFVIEERTERIHFYSRNGERRTIWEGLGEPPAFSVGSGMEDSVIVVESLPFPALVQVGARGTRRVFFDEFKPEESIGGVYSDSQTFVSFPNQGRIDRIRPNGQRVEFTREVFSPGKMLPGQGDVLWVLDRLTNEIIAFQKDNAEIVTRIRAEKIHLTDFQIKVEPEGEERLYVMDSIGKIYRYQASRGMFELLASLPPIERSLRSNTSMPSVFARVARLPGNGFIAALNDASGGLYWVKENGDFILMKEGFREISQLHYNSEKEELIVLSRRGWVRALSLEFHEDETPPPTAIPPPNTHIREWTLHEE